MATAPLLFFRKNDAYRVEAREGLRSFIDLLDLAEQEGHLNKEESFESVLRLGLTRIGLSAADLAREANFTAGNTTLP